MTGPNREHGPVQARLKELSVATQISLALGALMATTITMTAAVFAASTDLSAGVALFFVLFTVCLIFLVQFHSACTSFSDSECALNDE